MSQHSHNLAGKVVVLGASAGGLDPLRDFFGAFTGPLEDTAWVVIQHLSPDYKSMMSELLKGSTSMKIMIAAQNMPLESGSIYLIPPAFNLSVTPDRRFRLDDKTTGAVNLPIDIFATSAASIYGPAATLVIFSGTGSDGARGITAVKQSGGICFCQSSDSAQFDGMPNAAMSTGDISGSGNAEELALMVHSVLVSKDLPMGSFDGSQMLQDTDYRPSDLFELLQSLRQRCGVDFSQYKPSTVHRRIERRFVETNSHSLEDYIALTKSDPQELDILASDLLIGVTSFYRDPDAFDDLKDQLLKLVDQKQPGDTMRCWVAGCSTGEEAYSVAILLAECLQKLGVALDAKVFATDVEQAYVDQAIQGIYSIDKTNELPAGVREKYFVKEGERYRIAPEIRKNVIFARHNMISDAPFTRLDLISCRNVLIYFNQALQERVLYRFQYALNTGGLLFLGSSENMGAVQRDFAQVSSSSRIYRVLRPGVISTDALLTGNQYLPARNLRAATAKLRSDLIEEGRQSIIQEISPPSLLLNHHSEILHVYGDVSDYLKIAKGDMTFDLNRMVPGRISAAVSGLIRTVSKSQAPAMSAPIKQGGEADEGWFSVRVTPVAMSDAGSDALLLSFISHPSISMGQSEFDESVETAVDQRILYLQNELQNTQDNLKNTIEELEASNEELKATNEELLASNEELQSTNEELQSVNEELFTVNSEYQEKIKILDQLNADLDTMTEATGIPTVFLNRERKITRFTDSIGDIFDLRETDLGRSLESFSNKIKYSRIMEDAQLALETGKPCDVVWRTKETSMIIRYVPYVDGKFGKQALAILFIDVLTLEKLGFLQNVIDSLPEQIAVLDGNGDISMVNNAWREFGAANGAPDTQGLGIPYRSVCEVAKDSPDFETASVVSEKIQAILAGEESEFAIEYPCHSEDEERWFVMHAKSLEGASTGLVISHFNISVWEDRNRASRGTSARGDAA